MRNLMVMLLLSVVLAGCQALQRTAGPPHVMIRLDSDGCPTHAREVGNEGNGQPLPRCTRLNNMKRADLVCRQPGEDVIWRVAGNASFSIDFKKRNSWNCGSGPNNTYRCTVPGSATKKTYGYNIQANNCVLDPMILIH